MLPVDFIALMLVLKKVDFLVVKKWAEMHIIVLQDQYIADNFELVLLVGKGDKNAISQSWAHWH